MIVKPFTIAFDSSVLVDISNDYFHENPANRYRAIDVLNNIRDMGCIPLLTWHHIEELIAHRNKDCALKSINIIQEFPVVASLVSQGVQFHIGSTIDIETVEFNSILSDDNISLKSIIQKTRGEIIEFCSGKELITAYLQYLDVLREKTISSENKKREIASIVRAKTIEPKETKLSSLKNAKFRTLESAKSKLSKMQIQIEEEIYKKGDKKLDSPKQTAKNFIKEVFISGQKMLQTSGSVEERFLAEYGLTTEETKDFKTLEQIHYLSIFKKRLKVISKNFVGSKKKKLFEIDPEKCPTWLLWKELHKIRAKAERASGSDVNDGYLAGLVYYADLTIVDKRTNEYLSQIKRRCRNIAPLMNDWKKLSNYTDIIAYLPVN